MANADEQDDISVSQNEKNCTDVWEKISYTWIIRKMDSFFKNGAGHKTTSPRFSNKHGEDHVWEINFYPCGIDFIRSGSLGVYLYSVSKLKENVETKFTLSVRNSGDCVIGSESGEFCFANQLRKSGFDEIAKRSDVLLVVKDNIIKIHAEVLMQIHELEMEDYTVCPGPKFPEVKLQRSMAGLFDSCKFSDVAFHVGEKVFQVHKNILCARSPVFEAMFTHDNIESQSGVVKISDFEGENFKRFLSFVYSGQVDIPAVDNATELFRAAEKYDFPDLKLECVNYISSHLNSDNVGPVLLFAETFDAKDLKRIAMNYILENIEFFSNVEMEVYKLIEKQSPKLFPELLVVASQNFVLQNRKQ